MAGPFNLGGLCNCCSSSTKVCVSACSPAVNVSGATVQLLTGTTVVASCTTDSTGCCSFTQTGSYTLKVIISGTTCYSATQTLSGTTIGVNVSDCSGNLVCCGGYMIPETLTLTDAVGTLTMWYYGLESGTLYPTWYACRRVTKTACTVTTPNNICTPSAPSSQLIDVCYKMQCQDPSTPTFTMTRFWSWVNSGMNTYYYASGAACPTGGSGVLCATSPPSVCGNPNTDTADGSNNPSSSSPFSASFTLTPGINNSLADPVGGNVTVSQ